MRLKLLPFLAAAVLPVLLAGSFEARAATVVYCQYIGVPKGCVARQGVVLKPAPAVRAATPGVNTPLNRGGPVNRLGRR
jgi:hypothetical protein